MFFLVPLRSDVTLRLLQAVKRFKQYYKPLSTQITPQSSTFQQFIPEQSRLLQNQRKEKLRPFYNRTGPRLKVKDQMLKLSLWGGLEGQTPKPFFFRWTFMMFLASWYCLAVICRRPNRTTRSHPHRTKQHHNASWELIWVILRQRLRVVVL